MSTSPNKPMETDLRCAPAGHRQSIDQTQAVPQFLYIFGYETPEEARSNMVTGSDFESSAALLIDAATATEALQWGRHVSQNFVAWLFQRDGQPDADWTSLEFAHWLEPEGTAAWKTSRNVPHVCVGEVPPFELLL